MNIELKPIDKYNYEECVDLKVEEGQKSFVASNMYSLVQATYEDSLYPFAIYRDGVMTGFLMYGFDPEIGMWEMCRLMVDKRYQKQGIGREAISQLLEMVIKKHGHIELSTSVEPHNTVAAKLYESFGFVKNGRIIYDEEMMVKQL